MRVEVRVRFVIGVFLSGDGNIRRKVSFVFAGVSFLLPGVFGFHERFQVVQARGPELTVLLDPGVDCSERFRIELINTMAAFPVLANQVSTAQQTQVLRDSWSGNRESAGDLSSRLRAAAQEIENRATRRIGQSLKGGFAVPGRRICNRTVTHNA